MLQIDSLEELKKWADKRRCDATQKLALVPTMGYLHEGHLSLVKEAKAHTNGGLCAVSIFVNPAQFNDAEDLDKYPRNLEGDLEKLEEAGVDLVFTPNVREVYPHGAAKIVMDYPSLTNKLCGITRPGHFSGVLLIVHNLFLWFQPDYAIFGEKDYQQLLLIRKMTTELALPVEVIAAPIIREKEGLAMSSRNARLNDDDRKEALAIFEALALAGETLEKAPNGFQTNGGEIISEINSQMIERLKVAKRLKVEYAGLYNPETLEPLTPGQPLQPQKALAAIAAFVGEVRLIDNMLIEPR